MGKKLVIVESPAKAKTINKILGSDYVVESSVGHVRDLPERMLGVDVENGFKPKYVVAAGKKKVIDTLKREAKACDAIYLAPDPDREGEAIAWHIQELLKPGNRGKEFFRIQYNEITPRAVRQAFEHPGAINMARVDAQQARRVLDRLVGYMVSPMLWRRIQRGLSAGRVQSVALRLVCEREAEVQAFVPEPYWIIGAQVRKFVDPRDPFAITLSRIDDVKAEVNKPEQAAAIRAALEGRALKVVEIVKRAVTRNPLPPFITSTLQQAASSVCGYSPKRTMRLAQTLYEGVDLGEGPVGLITYMRTDSVTVSQDAMAATRAWVTETFGPDYVPEKPNVYRSRTGAQEAHEAIRPTDVTVTPDRVAHQLDPAAQRLYRLIWDRFVASQMSPAKLEQRTVKIEALPPAGQTTRYLFQATASDVLFPGFFKVMRLQKVKKEEGTEEGEEEATLPPLQEGEAVECLEWTDVRKETKPPARFSEASLVRELERNGVGRPSTYASILGTLQDRRYLLNEKRTLQPTDLGKRVNALLVETLNPLFSVTFTASMEELLDEVEAGKLEWTRMLADFYARFQEWMVNTRLPPADAAHVRAVLELLQGVTQWGEAVTRGKRTYSDEKFVSSVREQLDEGKKAISQRQLEALVRIAWRYKDQVPEVEARLRALGFGLLIDQPDMQPPDERTVRKLALALGLALSERSKAFVESLDGRVKGGRSLSPAQLDALHNILDCHATLIPDYDALREDLAMGPREAADTESGPLLAAMGHVQEWKPPVARGKRVFDDKAFHASLAQQHQGRGSLSPRQRAALKKMLARYRAQIPEYEALAAQYGIGRKSAEAKADAAADAAAPEGQGGAAPERE